MNAPELAPGQIVAGKYAIQSLIGHGGAIATYHAMTVPARQVALKLYDPALKSFPDVLKLLERYQTTTASLSSRSIAPIVERGEDPATGAPYTVTEFESHPSLTDLVNVCPLSIAEMVVLLGNLGRCVDTLHANGIVHLALHPNNIFVGPGPTYEVRVIDFGSGSVRKALGARERLAQKAPWLAPEQVQDGQTCDARTDVFAAALVAFFATSGQSYWRSCRKGAVDVAAWELEIAGARVPASKRAEELNLVMPGAFDGVFARALAARAKDRFGAVGAFASALATAAGADPHAASTSATFTAVVAPANADIPPPPPQMEAMLSAFEGKSPPVERISRVGMLVADTLAQSGPLPQGSDPLAYQMGSAEAIEAHDPPVDDRRKRTTRRARIGYAAGAVALLLGAGGAFAMFSNNKPPPPLAAGSSSAESKPVASAAPTEASSVPPIAPVAPTAAVVAADPAPSEAPSPPAPPDTEVAPEKPAPAATAAPPRAPAWRRPVAAPRQPPPPPKKPCGKFLKRCT
jgi:serine/threonine protein kinase